MENAAYLVSARRNVVAMQATPRSGERTLLVAALALWVLRYVIFMVIGGVFGNVLGHETIGVFAGLVVCRVAQGVFLSRLGNRDGE